jgi:hypothetical protein
VTDSEIVQALVWSVDPLSTPPSAVVVVGDVITTVYPQDGALPEPGGWISCVRNGGDLIPFASSQRVGGTFRGAIEAESFLGTSETTIDTFVEDYTWTPLANTIVAQPVEGTDPPWMRLTRANFNGKVQATITVPLSGARRYQAIELSAPAAATTGRDCYARVDFLINGAVSTTYLYHLDNLYADPRSIQSEPLMPPPFATHMKVTVYSEAAGLIPGAFMDVRLRAWTVPVFQGGALVNLDGEVLFDHRGFITGGYPLNEEDRTIIMTPWSNTFNFPAYSNQSTYRFKRIGNQCKIKLTARCTGAGPPTASMSFLLPYQSRDHDLFSAVYLNSGVAWHVGGAHVDAGTSTVYLLQNDPGANNGNVDESNPFAFGNGDMIIVSGMYEIQT